jgi:hypothetical protein
MAKINAKGGGGKKAKEVPVPVPSVRRTNTERTVFLFTAGGEGDNVE